MGASARIGAVVAAFLVPVIAGVIALTLVHEGPPMCDATAVRFEDLGEPMCAVPTNPPDAPSSVVNVPATVDHHVAERVWVIGVGVVSSIALFALVARSREDEDERPSVLTEH